MGRSRRANAGSRLASLLRQEGGKAAYQQPESESEESQERGAAWAQHGVVGWGGYGLAGGGGSSDSEEEGGKEARGGGGWYGGEAAGREEDGAEEPQEEEGQFDDPMDADYALADVALERVRCCVLWLACHVALLLLLACLAWCGLKPSALRPHSAP